MRYDGQKVRGVKRDLRLMFVKKINMNRCKKMKGEKETEKTLKF